MSMTENHQISLEGIIGPLLVGVGFAKLGKRWTSHSYSLWKGVAVVVLGIHFI